MVEAIGLAFTIAGLVVPACQGLMGYYKAYNRSKQDINRYRVDLQRLDDRIADFRRLNLDSSSQTIPNVLRDFDDVLRDLERILKKYAPPGPGDELRRRDRVKYLFDQPKFREAINRVEKMHADLNAALHAYQTRKQRWNEFQTWLSAPNTHEDHARIYREMVSGSGSWVLETPQICDWRSSEESGVVWIHGRPGAGKSTIASNLVTNLLEKIDSDPGVAIAYIYHDSRDPQKFESRSRVIAAIIWQLCDALGDIPGQIMELCEKHKSPEALDTQHIVWVAQKFKTVYLAIDGLDEWHSTRRGELMDLLLQLRNETTVTFKILITSRLENQISLKLEDCKTIDLVKEADQVTGDIERVMRAKVDSLLRSRELYLQDPTRKEEIVSVLTSKSEGIFLWATLALEDLGGVSVRTEDDHYTFKCLDTLPSGMDKFYERILTNILKPQVLRNLVKQSLGWLYYSKRLLTARELMSGLSYDRSLEAPDIIQILSACHPLLKEHDGNLQFVHFSFKQYLGDKPENFSWLLESPPAMTTACLKCLSDVTNRCRLHIKESPRELLIAFPFSQHAADHWGHYAAEALPHDKSGRLGQEVETFLLTQDSVAASGKLMSPIYYFHEAWPFPTVNDLDLHGPLDAMGLVAYFGLHTLIPIMSKCVESTPYPEPDGIRTHLAVAARNGHLQCVRMLASIYPHHVNCKDGQGVTPLSWAAILGLEDVIRELARNPGLDAASRDDEGRTAISFAAEFGYPSIVHRLRNLNESVVDVPDDDCQTPLYWAASSNHLDTVKVFIEEFGVQTNLDILLKHAVEYDSAAVARYLMESHRANPFAEDDSGKIPFLIAVERGNKDIVEIMDRQWSVGKSSRDFLISRQRRKEIYSRGLLIAIDPMVTPIFNYTHQEWLIRTLLPKADVNYSDASGRTPLIAAASKGSEAIVEMLLKDPDININKTDETYKSAWLYARDNNHFSVMDLLQNNEANDCIQVDYKEIYRSLFPR